MINTQQAVELNNAVMRQFPNPGTRLSAFTLATAFSIARGLPMPSTPVDNPDNYFLTTSSLGLIQLIDNVNEVCVIDRHAARAAVKSFWMVRYHALFPAAWVPEDGYDFFCSVSKVPAYFTKEQYALLCENKAAVLRVADALTQVFAGAK